MKIEGGDKIVCDLTLPLNNTNMFINLYSTDKFSDCKYPNSRSMFVCVRLNK